jgi:hypothetical protein
MTAFLCKSKAMLLQLMKMLPNAHIAEEEDFVAWGRQFVDIAVSHQLLEGGDIIDADFICKGNLTDLRRILHSSLAKGNPK